MSTEIELTRTPTTTNRIVLSGDAAILVQEQRFVLGPSDLQTLVAFLRQIRADRNHLVSLSDDRLDLSYVPNALAIDNVRITKGVRTMVIAVSTAFRLLHELSPLPGKPQ